MVGVVFTALCLRFKRLLEGYCVMIEFRFDCGVDL